MIVSLAGDRLAQGGFGLGLTRQLKVNSGRRVGKPRATRDRTSEARSQTGSTMRGGDIWFRREANRRKADGLSGGPHGAGAGRIPGFAGTCQNQFLGNLFPH